MGRINSNRERKLKKRLESSSIKSKQKNREKDKIINHVKKRQNVPKNSNAKEIKNIDEQEEILSKTASERSSIISSGRNNFLKKILYKFN
jgi:hypothetical protein